MIFSIWFLVFPRLLSTHWLVSYKLPPPRFPDVTAHPSHPITTATLQRTSTCITSCTDRNFWRSPFTICTLLRARLLCHHSSVRSSCARTRHRCLFSFASPHRRISLEPVRLWHPGCTALFDPLRDDDACSHHSCFRSLFRFRLRKGLLLLLFHFSQGHFAAEVLRKIEEFESAWLFRRESRRLTDSRHSCNPRWANRLTILHLDNFVFGELSPAGGRVVGVLSGGAASPPPWGGAAANR